MTERVDLAVLQGRTHTKGILLPLLLMHKGLGQVVI